MGSQYTTEELDWLKENYAINSIKICAKKLNRTVYSIVQKANKLGYQRKKMQPINPENKICSKCKIEQSKSNFSNYKRYKKDGLDCQCRTCKNAYFAARNKKLANKKQIEKLSKRLENPIECRKYRLLVMLQSAKKRTRERNLEYNLNYQWIDSITKENCPVFGFPFVFSKRYDKFSFKCPSIDRINNTKGYTQDNCVIVSRLANTMKSIGTVKQLIQLAEFYENLGQETIDYQI